MTYFNHTLKGCGTVALALVLSACGEKTASVSDLAVGQGLESQTSVNVETPSTINPGINQDQAPAPEFSSVGTPSDRVTAPDMTDSIGNSSDSSAPATPNTPVTSDLNPVDVALGENQMTAPIQEAPAGESVAVGGDPLVTLIATTDSDLNSSGTRLVWTSENVDSCVASGGWEGNIDANGALDLQHEEAGDITYLINCSGASGSAVAMVTVTVESTALAWQAPVQNTNGTVINDLAGYNLYYGTESGRYTQVRAVRDASQTNLELPVEPGTYYLAMTAYDISGNESELSNEIIRHVF